MAIFQCFKAFNDTAPEHCGDGSSPENMRIFKASVRGGCIPSLYKQKDNKTTQKRL